MLVLWRKLKLTKSVYFRPLANYSSNSLTNINQVVATHKDSAAEHGSVEMACKSATDPFHVLSALPSNPSEFRTMPSATVIQALQTISILQRTHKDTIKCDFITSHPKFEQLCRRLKRCSPSFTPDELIKSFRFLCSLDVPTNSEISLVLLNLIRHEINHLSVEKIVYLDFILGQTKCQSELQKVIQTALPMVFELQLPQQIDKENRVADLVSILGFFATHKGLDTKNIKEICNLLYNKSEEITSNDAIEIIYRLCAIDRFHVPNTIKLIAICIRKLLQQLAEIDTIELQRVVDRLIFTTLKKFSPFQFHLHSLLNGFAARISKEDLGLNAALSLQKSIKNISFQSEDLLTYISDTLISNAEYCRDMSSFEVFTIIQAFANNCFIPQNAECQDNIWINRILPEILANKQLNQISEDHHTWLQFTLQLTILGHYDQKLISRVLNSSYLANYLKRRDLSTLDLYKILILYQTVAMQPNIDISCVDKTAILDICRKYINELTSCDIQLDLIDHFGKASVLTNVRTKYMHLIPTLVKVNKVSGHIERFGDDIARDEDGFIPLDAIPHTNNEQLVCVDSVKRYYLFSNVASKNGLFGVRDITDDMKIGMFRLRSKQLEALQLSVCEINYRRYKNLRMGRKYEYLQESILKCAQKTPLSQSDT